MPVEHRDYPDIAPAGPTYSRGTKAGNLLFISGCTARGSEAQGKPLMEQLDETPEAGSGRGPGRGRLAGRHRQDNLLRHQHRRLAEQPGTAGGTVRQALRVASTRPTRSSKSPPSPSRAWTWKSRR